MSKLEDRLATAFRDAHEPVPDFKLKKWPDDFAKETARAIAQDLYALLPEEKEKYPVTLRDRETNKQIDTNITHGLTREDAAYNRVIQEIKEKIKEYLK